jgi:hypothetical protein
MGYHARLLESESSANESPYLIAHQRGRLSLISPNWNPDACIALPVFNLSYCLAQPTVTR